MINANLRLTPAEQEILNLIKNGEGPGELELQREFDLLTQDWCGEDRHRFGLIFRCLAATAKHLNRTKSTVGHTHAQN